MNTQLTSIIPGEDTIINANDNFRKGQNDRTANADPTRLNNEEKVFMLNNYRLDTDNGELFIAMFG